ncbi:MAG: DUF4932 domain-containing protein [Turicibacter sp.]|nr:DUF4932 domain-containing protein [Turicibacter sp.]
MKKMIVLTDKLGKFPIKWRTAFAKRLMSAAAVGVILAFAACAVENAENPRISVGGVDSATSTRLTIPNFVSEQIELMSVILRIAGSGYSHIQELFGSEVTPYQRSLSYTFGGFSDHPVMAAARELRLIYIIDSGMAFAIHLEKADGEFRLLQGSTFWEESLSPWTADSAAEFLVLLNDFYIVSGFGDFFRENIWYFEEHSQRLYDELLSQINFDWFYQFGFGLEDLRIAVRPSGENGAFGPTLLNTVNYAILPRRDHYWDFSDFSLIIHEFAHSFANPIAEKWYAENEEFRLFSQNSANHRRMPTWYSSSLTVAFEYVTRAYTILYFAENHDYDLLPLFLADYNLGFTNIEAVYAMITEHEPILTLSVRIFAAVERNVEFIVGFFGGAVFVGLGAFVWWNFRKARFFR